MTDKPNSERRKPTALFRLERKLLDEVERAAKADGITKTDCFTAAIIEWLARRRKRRAAA